jgi:hypothetical protein
MFLKTLEFKIFMNTRFLGKPGKNPKGASDGAPEEPRKWVQKGPRKAVGVLEERRK